LLVAGTGFSSGLDRRFQGLLQERLGGAQLNRIGNRSLRFRLRSTLACGRWLDRWLGLACVAYRTDHIGILLEYPRVGYRHPEQPALGGLFKKYLAEHPRTVPIVLTKDTNLAAMYNAQVYPIYVVLDRDGNIAGEQRGAGERGLRRMLKRAGIESKQESEE
jgi:hypothetical protein